MTSKLILALSIGLLVATSPVHAFDEQQAPQTEAAGDAADLASQEAPPANKGTEVTIPGLGSLGVLPKMDFGLELLYGADETKPVEAEQQNPALAPQPDDLTIRGTMKHNF